MLAPDQPRSNINFMPTTRGTTWFAMLRKRRRGVALTLLPALAFWAASGSACLTMLLASTPAHAHAGHSASEHTGHHAGAHPAAHDPAPAPADCPHCPPGHSAGNVAHSSCAQADVAADGKALHKSCSAGAPLLAAARWAVPAAAAAPPLIHGTASNTTRPLAAVPIHIRHCVFLV